MNGSSAAHRWRRLLTAVLLGAMMALASGCGQDTDYRSLLDDLTNGNDEQQYNAAIDFGNDKDTRVVEVMTIIVAEEKDPFVREAVAWALGEIGDPAAVEALSRAAVEDDSGTVRENAIYSLGQIGDPSALTTLTRILMGEDRPNIEAFEADREEPNEALLAAFSLRRIGAPAIESLIEAAAAEDITVRRVAIATLGEVGLDTGNYGAVPFLLATLSDPETLIRETAAHALIITGDASSIEGLVAALNANGTGRMAGFFLNSGQEQLVAAASSWIAANGLDADTIRCSVNGKARWGAYDAESKLEGC